MTVAKPEIKVKGPPLDPLREEGLPRGREALRRSETSLSAGLGVSRDRLADTLFSSVILHDPLDYRLVKLQAF